MTEIMGAAAHFRQKRTISASAFIGLPSLRPETMLPIANAYRFDALKPKPNIQIRKEFTARRDVPESDENCLSTRNLA